MILAIGSPADQTFLYMLGRLRTAGVEVAALDPIEIALTGTFDLESDRPFCGRIRTPRCEVTVDDVTGCWFRLPDLCAGAPDAQSRERLVATQRALAATLNGLPIPVMNAPMPEPSNFSKGAHLAYLHDRTGLPVPATCITNDPVRAMQFVDSFAGRVIYKGASASKTWVRQWDVAADAARLDRLRTCPVLLQELIAGPDVRVHVAGNDAHAEMIESVDIDYRRGSANKFRRIDCPDEIVGACLKLSVAMRAPLLGVDFKIDADTGRWFILEANTLPCFAGYDMRSDCRISASIVGYLTQTSG